MLGNNQMWTHGNNLEVDARLALGRLKELNLPYENYSSPILASYLRELERYLDIYVDFHKDLTENNVYAERRRKDHWDLVNEKCTSDPMFKDLWDQILVLLRLEQN